MTYRSSTVPGGVLIDGRSDTVGSAVPTWEALNGPQGRVYTRSTTSSSQGNLAAGTTHFYRDLVAPAESQCWGDRSYYGASGTFIQTGIANTDPRSTPTVKLTGTRINQFLPPAADPSKVAAYAADWAADAGAPLTTTVSAYPG